MPTPFVGNADATRIVKIKYCQCKTITRTIADQITLLSSRQKPADFPLSVEQCLTLIAQIEGQLPQESPECCCMDQSITLLESEIYLLNRWRVWLEEQMATHIAKADLGTLRGVMDSKRAELEYALLGEIRQRLASPLSKP